jgi:glyoxylase-like metal-dependent hydrolase (beta-lactamase superfamily II)
MVVFKLVTPYVRASLHASAYGHGKLALLAEHGKLESITTEVHAAAKLSFSVLVSDCKNICCGGRWMYCRPSRCGHDRCLAAMAPAMDWPLRIPHSDKTVNVSIIDTTTRVGNIPLSHYQGPPGCYPTLSVPGEPTPSYSFLISHKPSQTKVLFDLGLRTDWESTSTPGVLHWLRETKASVSVDKDVATILKDAGVDPQQIDAVIYSHQHFDHTGDPRTLSPRTKIIVGPGYKSSFLPGWPAKKRSWDTTSDLYEGRMVTEIDFTSGFCIGSLQAFDYFGDGSFYLLSSPGHTVAHLSVLARTTAPLSEADESTFILLGGDIAHNPALFRPSVYHPLPEKFALSNTESGPQDELSTNDLLRIHRNWKDRPNRALHSPYCTAQGPHHDVQATQDSIDKLSALDAMDNVFTVLAHDGSLLDAVDFFPKPANDWKAKGWKERCRWTFLSDFVPQPATKSVTKL